jgi:phenylpyruvate tautomerase PptA (4-oxalocrotonate tautomerase family)
MPLVRIDAAEGRKPEDLAAIGDGVHRALIEAIGIPPLDCFQVHTLHSPGRFVYDPEYLAIARSPGVVFVQITMSVGRTLEQKKALFAAIARNLAEKPGLRIEDVFVNLVEVVKENWSFGNGIAQYAP